MGRRFSRIKEGQKLAAAWTAYKNYWDTAATRPSGIGTGQARILDAVVYIQPYTTNVGVSEVVSAKAYNEGYTNLVTYINSATQAQVTSTIGANTLINIPKFKPARVVWQRAATRSVSTPPSKFTGQEYLKYNNIERFSCPFGASSDADDLMEGFLEIKAALLAVTGFQVNRVSLSREYVGVEPA